MSAAEAVRQGYGDAYAEDLEQSSESHVERLRRCQRAEMTECSDPEYWQAIRHGGESSGSEIEVMETEQPVQQYQDPDFFLGGGTDFLVYTCLHIYSILGFFRMETLRNFHP